MEREDVDNSNNLNSRKKYACKCGKSVNYDEIKGHIWCLPDGMTFIDKCVYCEGDCKEVEAEDNLSIMGRLIRKELVGFWDIFNVVNAYHKRLKVSEAKGVDIVEFNNAIEEYIDTGNRDKLKLLLE